MRILFIGDIVGKPGRDIVCRAVPGLVVRERLDLVIANAENAAGGSAHEIYRDLIAAGVDGITLGDHVYRRREIMPVLQRESNIVRPANLPDEAVGRTWATLTARDGTPVGFFTLLGQLFMKPADSPYRVADQVLAAMTSDIRVRFLDFHAEATSEAQMMGRSDGRVAAVLARTHAPLRECIFPAARRSSATGCLPTASLAADDRVLGPRLTANPTQFDVAEGDVRLCGSIVDIDPASGLAASIERVCVRESDL
jgi:calcineurin-like phosphoesterase